MRRMAVALVVSLTSLLPRPALASTIPLSGTDEIVGPWQLNQIYYGHVRLTAVASLPPFADPNIPNTIGAYAVYTSFVVASGDVINASGIAALGNLEVIGQNYPVIACKTCSATGDLIWYGEPSIKRTISWDTRWLKYGHAGILDVRLFLDLPEGFSLASQQIAAVPEPSTWLTMLTGLALVYSVQVARRRSGAD
ncbi:MAG: hypothetical protein E6614_01545 [Bradyrhizobium sp.]|jgi:hypothetical protein|uniref:PEP-CTERM protein-sorting domain-containing protein n=2 Tax=Bradyrhizobium TaxID=374 RepID=A0ABS5G6J9_9BRAD|nr:MULTISPECIES: hypothetical protein [Bradyrhizobium]MBR1136883.1 hypothetical protein [Bradyrhizobium denitrificans]MDU1493096.1 hypothetical protein [Bradyrhizobium sp.]MDU1543199.1 hypothetical protein [Bradyrhizobium sp.]MDU1668482.1 hypothetical protein [Bradyrhizobium sp.]MDU1695828.1 hypothetical protein [Bradyrhizobium sp.]